MTTKRKLNMWASLHGRSLEAEAREAIQAHVEHDLVAAVRLDLRPLEMGAKFFDELEDAGAAE